MPPLRQKLEEDQGLQNEKSLLSIFLESQKVFLKKVLKKVKVL